MKKLNGPTITDVAERAGVSISTVSRVINRNLPVSDDVLARVEAAMRDLKYAPRAAARNLATRKTNTIGLLLGHMLGDFFGPLLTGVEDVAAEHGYGLLISTAGHRGGPRNEMPATLGNHNADGVLVFTGVMSSEGVEHAHSMGLPMVLIHQSAPSELAIPCVTIENKSAACAIVEHLITAHGRRRIVLLRGIQHNEDALWREMGYREALEKHRLPFEECLVMPGDFERTVAHDSVNDLLRRGVEFDAIFSGDDEAAVGAIQALHAAGRRVPQDVAVVGFDNTRLAAVLTPPLTTVHAPTEEVGRAATQQLIRLVRTGQADILTLLPTELVLRQSCGCGS